MFKKKVDVVVIYATSPVKKIVGEFETGGIVSGAPDDVWEKCNEFAGIDRALFDVYFQKSKVAYAIKIRNVVRYDNPLDLFAAYGIKPPQSFCYIKC